MKATLMALALLTAGSPQAYAQAMPATAAVAPSGASATRHSGTFNGQKLNYVATVGETIVTDKDGVPTISFVTTAYVREGMKNQAARPVIFLFNGGPSSSSSWLHMGAFGPKRITVPQDVGAPVPTPYTLQENPYTVLDVADLVFVDPAETGFSRVLPGGKRAEFYTADGDAKSVARFVEAWIKANGREASPKFVLGESYGTIRAALMAGELAKTMPLDGVVLMGQATNMIETSQRASNVMAYAANLPALAAIAAYHGRADLGGKSMAAFIDEAYAYGMGEYLSALAKGADLPQSDREAIAGRLQQMTGISADYYLAHRLVITKVDFVTELLKDKGLMLGTYDARYTGPAPKAGERPLDPFAKVGDMVAPLLAEHLNKNLKVSLPTSDYRAFAPDTRGWFYNPTGGAGGPFNDYDYPAMIGQAFAANPKFRLMVGTGIYDLTTTVGPARYLAAQGYFPKDRVSQKTYEGGHMAYTNEAALKAFTNDVRAFVTPQP